MKAQIQRKELPRDFTVKLPHVIHHDVIKWKHFPRYWPFVRGIYRSPVNSPHKGQWRGALMFFFICAWISGSVNKRVAGDLRHHRAQFDVTVMFIASNTNQGWPIRDAWERNYIAQSKAYLLTAFGTAQHTQDFVVEVLVLHHNK